MIKHYCTLHTTLHTSPSPYTPSLPPPLSVKPRVDVKPRLVPKASRKWFYANELATIYKYPPKDPSNVVVAVVSFGGGLFGDVSSDGVLTNGDVQAYWTSIGITDHPRVIIKTINGAVNSPISVNDNGTAENTLDIETLGACCPTSKLTIIMYLAPNSFAAFHDVINYIISDTDTPTIISISWGAPERVFGSYAASINTLFASAVSKGISIFAATGDYGSSDGLPGLNVDFPSSSPHVIACGGTTLVCPNSVYDTQTRETAWLNGGGGVSVVFPKPSYQTGVPSLTQKTGRSTPDISSNADPSTGVGYYVNKAWHVFGGTSVSAPTIAAYFACTGGKGATHNDVYSLNSSCFHDVINGTNGFYKTTIGYDNCTGLGSIIGDVMTGFIGGGGDDGGSTLNTYNISLVTGETYQLILSPPPTSSDEVAWTSSNTDIVSVSDTGLVTGVTPGTATVTVSLVDTVVTVTVSNLLVSSLRLTPMSQSSIYVGNTYTIVPIISPSNATNQSLIWSSSNSGILTVSDGDGGGVVNGIRAGRVIITARTTDGSKKLASIAITVSNLLVSSLTFPVIPSINVGNTYTIVPNISPGNATKKTLTWLSSNNRTLTVSSYGVVKGIRIGKAVVTAKTTDGSRKSVSAMVTVI